MHPRGHCRAVVWGSGNAVWGPAAARCAQYRPLHPQPARGGGASPNQTTGLLTGSILVGAGVWLPASPIQQMKTPGTLEMGGEAPRPGCCAHGRVPCAHECAQETRPCAQHSGHSAVPPTSGPTVRSGCSATVRDGSCREAQRRGRVGRLSAEGASGGSAPRVRRLLGGVGLLSENGLRKSLPPWAHRAHNARWSTLRPRKSPGFRAGGPYRKAPPPNRATGPAGDKRCQG